jgi:hypothetical protein
MRNYKSKFEKTVGDFLGTNAEYETDRINFVQPAKDRYYVPDFKTKAGVYLETKGKFTSDDRMKHLWLREQHPDKRIVLVFMNANVKLNKKSKTSYGMWATKNSLEWYNWKDGIPEELYIDENTNSSGNKGRTSRSKSKPIRGADKVPARSRAKRNPGKGSI